MATTLYELICKESERLSDQQMREVLVFIEFIGMRENKDFLDYINKRTQQAINARQRGAKFHNLAELQKEFGKE